MIPGTLDSFEVREYAAHQPGRGFGVASDHKGLNWEFVWKTKAFPHRKALIVRIYMKDGSAVAEREQVVDQG
jgi:hypothetical protein